MAAPGGRWGSSWTTVLVASLALLVVPFAVWLLLPPPDVTLPPQAIAQTPEAPRAPVEPAAATARAVSGHVSDEAGAPISGARVRIDVGGRSVDQTITDGDGAYSMANLPPEGATLIAEKEGFGLASERVEAAEAGEAAVVDLVLTKAEGVSGMVLDHTGRPVSQAFVGCEDHEDPLHGGHSDTEGRFNLPADVAGCRAIANHPSFGPSEVVILRAGDDNLLRLAGPGGIAGVVVDERGAPVTEFLIGIESYKPPPGVDTPPLTGNGRQVLEPSGTFELKPLSAGIYILTASAEGRPPASSEAITVEPGRTSSGVRITLPVGAALAGRVTDKDSGRPVSGASVRLDAATATGAVGVPPTTTDDQGQFTLVGVPSSGRFSVRIDKEGYNSSVVPGLDAGGAREVRRDFQLTPGEGETEMAGIGAVLAPSPLGILVGGVIDGGPAAEAGLKIGDRILRIDGDSAESKSLSQVIQILRGPEGSRVSVSVERSGEGTVEVTMVRALIVR